MEPLHIRAGLAEELQLHLLKLPGAEGEVAWRDLIAEGLADLTDSKGDLLSGGTLHILEIDKNSLCRLRAQIDGVLGVLGDPLEGLEHEVELADLREVVLAAGGTGNIVLLNPVLHLFVGPAVNGRGQGDLMLLGEILDDLVRPEALMALLAVHQRVGEGTQMTGGNPGLRIHEDGAVNADILRTLLDKLLPPGPLDIILELNAQVPIIPGIGQASIDL